MRPDRGEQERERPHLQAEPLPAETVCIDGIILCGDWGDDKIKGTLMVLLLLMTLIACEGRRLQAHRICTASTQESRGISLQVIGNGLKAREASGWQGEKVRVAVQDLPDTRCWSLTNQPLWKTTLRLRD